MIPVKHFIPDVMCKRKVTFSWWLGEKRAKLYSSWHSLSSWKRNANLLNISGGSNSWNSNWKNFFTHEIIRNLFYLNFWIFQFISLTKEIRNWKINLISWTQCIESTFWFSNILIRISIAVGQNKSVIETQVFHCFDDQ